MLNALKDRYGFWFWLRWIVWFAGSFVVSAAGWTTVFQLLFGPIRGPELTFSWCVAVFGSWFLLVIPFMRKKEQIWKRLNDDQEKAVDAWFLGMGLFIGGLILTVIAADFWFRESLADAQADLSWMKFVFSAWLVTFIPFLVFMYRKADVIFRNAEARQTYAPRYRQLSVDRSSRLLPTSLAEALKKQKETMPGGHVVTLRLKDGRLVDDVFVRRCCEIVGVYGQSRFDLTPSDILDLSVKPQDQLPAYQESNWLRLDI